MADRNGWRIWATETDGGLVSPSVPNLDRGTGNEALSLPAGAAEVYATCWRHADPPDPDHTCGVYSWTRLAPAFAAMCAAYLVAGPGAAPVTLSLPRTITTEEASALILTRVRLIGRALTDPAMDPDHRRSAGVEVLEIYRRGRPLPFTSWDRQSIAGLLVSVYPFARRRPFDGVHGIPGVPDNPARRTRVRFASLPAETKLAIVLQALQPWIGAEQIAALLS